MNSLVAAHSAMAKILLLGLAVVGLATISCSLVSVAQATDASSSVSYIPLYVFGGSFGDRGNNNYLATTVRADSPPYGIDSPTGRPSGRFSNYRNLPDFLSIALGLPEPPSPYLSPELNGERLRYGCNFASGGAGILNDTGLQLGNIITMPEQLEAFKRYQAQLAAIVGGREQAQRLVSQGVAHVTLGPSDFLGNYFPRPFSARSTQYTVSEFVDYLISELSKILLRLYGLGARRIVVVGVGSFGCWPAQLAMRGPNDGVCDPEMQSATSLFNSQLNLMTRQLNDEVGGVHFIALNPVTLSNQVNNNPGAYGFTETNAACCGQGPYNGLGQCTPASNLCPNRDEYIYWDSTSFTDKSTSIFAESILNGPVDSIFPINLNTMLGMNNET